MTRVKLRCIMRCAGLKSSYQERGLLSNLESFALIAFIVFKLLSHKELLLQTGKKIESAKKATF